MKERLQEERQNSKKIDHGRRRRRLLQPTRNRTVESLFLNTTVDADRVFHREDRHGDRVKYRKLDIHHIINDLNRFQNRNQDGGNNEEADENIEILLKIATIAARKDKRVQALAECPIRIHFNELAISRNDDSE